MKEFKLTKIQKRIIDYFCDEFGVHGCVSYYSINGYLQTAVEAVKNDGFVHSSVVERAIREYLLNRYNNETYHYMDNYEEDIKGEVLL